MRAIFIDNVIFLAQTGFLVPAISILHTISVVLTFRQCLWKKIHANSCYTHDYFKKIQTMKTLIMQIVLMQICIFIVACYVLPTCVSFTVNRTNYLIVHKDRSRFLKKRGSIGDLWIHWTQSLRDRDGQKVF